MANLQLIVTKTVQNVAINATSTVNSLQLLVTPEQRNVQLVVNTLVGTVSTLGRKRWTLIADGPTTDGSGDPTYNPPSGQNRIYLPSATADYDVFKDGMLLLPDIDYTRTAGNNYLDLLIGDIGEYDKFRLCVV